LWKNDIIVALKYFYDTLRQVFKESDQMIYFDSDGLFSDFDNHSMTLLGVHPRTVGDQKFWEVANGHPLFWTEMTVMEGAHDFWDKIKHLDPTVLTGAPKGNYQHATEAKKAWWKKEFNHDKVIVCLSKNKQDYITHPDDLLVDDTFRNIKRWRAAGGRAIHFQNYEQALAELKEMGIL
jgi:hypothetical protein